MWNLIDSVGLRFSIFSTSILYIITAVVCLFNESFRLYETVKELHTEENHSTCRMLNF